MEDLKNIKRLITDAVDKVFSLPKIEVGNFSSEKLKEELIPLLKDAERRIYDIEFINENLSVIRREITEPVNTTIKENSKKSNWLAWIGIFSGLVGLVLTCHSFLSSKVMLSDETLTHIKKINTDLVEEQIVLKAREIIKYNNEPKHEQKISLTYKTEHGKEAMEEFYNYLIGIGYKNISIVSQDRISHYSSNAENTIPYIYYRTRDINSDIINGIEQLSNYYQSLRYGNIIALMYYEHSTAKYVKWFFDREYTDNELLIVL